MDHNQKNIPWDSSSEVTDRVFETALSLVPAAEALARRYQLSVDTAHEVMMEAAKRVVESTASARYQLNERIRNLPAYLFSIGRHLMLAELRRKKEEGELDEHQYLAETDVSLETRILMSEIVQRMSPKVRTIFRYRTLGYGYDEIASKFHEMGYRATGASLRSEMSKATRRITEELKASTRDSTI